MYVYIGCIVCVGAAAVLLFLLPFVTLIYRCLLCLLVHGVSIAFFIFLFFPRWFVCDDARPNILCVVALAHV